MPTTPPIRIREAYAIPRWLVRIWPALRIVLLAELGLFIYQGWMSLIFRNYANEWRPQQHLVAFGMVWLILRGLRWIERHLDATTPWQANVRYRFSIQLLASFLLAAMVTFGVPVGVQGLGMGFGGNVFVTLPEAMIPVWVGTVLTSLIVLTTLGVFLTQRWQASALEAERFRKENIEFRFDMLRNQVNPHFLFNSLNTLAGLVYHSADDAARFVRQLAQVYRYVLDNKDLPTTTLADELAVLDAYLYMMRIRFGAGLQVAVDVPEQYYMHRIPPVSLQLLLENAIKHNIVSESRPLAVRVYITDGRRLVVENALQLKSTPEPSSRTGLANIRNRYAFLTDDPVEVIEGPEIFTVSLPLLAPGPTPALPMGGGGRE